METAQKRTHHHGHVPLCDEALVTPKEPSATRRGCVGVRVCGCVCALGFRRSSHHLCEVTTAVFGGHKQQGLAFDFLALAFAAKLLIALDADFFGRQFGRL